MVLTIASFEYAFLPSYKFHVTGLTQFCPSNSEKKKKKKTGNRRQISVALYQVPHCFSLRSNLNGILVNVEPQNEVLFRNISIVLL